MLDQTHREGILRFCLERGKAFMAYSPMAQGLLTGKVTAEREFGKTDQRPGMGLFSLDNRRKVLELLQAIQPIAEGHEITLAQLALAWTFHQPGITYVLAGTRNPQQAQENARAGEVELSTEEVALIDAAIAKHWTPLE
jgi:aryl-alcohol dehydrogenase-like predicted oxidoreductase